MRAIWWFPLALAAACSSSVDAPNADPQAPVEEPDDSDSDSEGPSSTRDAGSKDAGTKDAPTKDGSGPKKDGGSTEVDAAIDAAPLGCVTAAVPTTCGSTFSATSTATAGIPLTEMGSALRVAVDRSGQMHGAWSTPTQGIRYAASATSTFAVETLAQPSGLDSEVFLFPRVVVDECGRPFVAYLHKHLPSGTDVTESHVYLATKTAGGWLTQEVEVPSSATDATPATDVHTVDLTLDGAGKPVLAMGRWATKSVYLATPTNVGFAVEEVPDAIGVQLPGMPAVAFSSTLGVVLGVDVTSKPTLMWKTGTTWNKSTVTTTHTMDTGRMIAIASDAQGAVHVAWRQSLSATASSQQKLGFYYAKSSAAGALTTEETVQTATGPNVPYSLSLSLHVGPGNVPVVGIDGFPVRRKTTGFVKTPVVTGMVNYRSAGMALDTSGRARALAFGYSAGAVVTESCP